MEKPDGIGLVVTDKSFIKEGNFTMGILEPTFREFYQHDED